MKPVPTEERTAIAEELPSWSVSPVTILAVLYANGILTDIVTRPEATARMLFQRPNQIFFCIFHTILLLLVLLERVVFVYKPAFCKNRLLGIDNSYRRLEIGN